MKMIRSIACAFLLLLAPVVIAQTAYVRPLVTQPVDESKLTVVRGNTHPLARAEFDRGAAPADLPMDNMLLVLKRSPEQEAALEQFMAEQLDKSSPNYHKWLTPAQFGQQFGAADSDIQAVTSWLTSHGFQVGKVSTGRTVIQFSGTAGQVAEAFHAPIHSYLVNGEQHWANANDPSIPTALTPAVAGVASLHNFYPKAANHVTKTGASAKVGGGTSPVRPQYTTSGDCADFTETSCFLLGPADLATIYSVPTSTLTGAGETIAIVSDSDIFLQDVNDFRCVFGITPTCLTYPANPPQNVTVTETGTAPGLTGDEVEAILDVEWSSAVAPGAMINLVVSPSTNSTFGGDTSATFIVNEATPPPILSESYGLCELGIGTTHNGFYNSTWQQAAAEGITVIVSTGDNGAAGCDVTQTTVFSAQPAQLGLAVNGMASTPYNTAVGGTDFNDLSDLSNFWTQGNNLPSQESATGYIPEMSWNDSCTNFLAAEALGTGANDTQTTTIAQATCQDAIPSQQDLPFLIVATGGSGGMSNCTTSNGQSPSSCAGGYPKPSWQTALTPADGARDLPDVSLFAGDGAMSDSAYIDCEEDLNASTTGAFTSDVACNLGLNDFLIIGGTSVSTQVFAGIMALVDQKVGFPQGNINPVLYNLAAQETPANCNSSNIPAGCVFYDVTVGTNSVPCVKNSTDCSTASGDTYGVLTNSSGLAFDAGTGYDLATGLGSVNVKLLANNWPTAPGLTVWSPNPNVTLASATSSGAIPLVITSLDGFSGAVDFSSSSCTITGFTCTFPAATTIKAGATLTENITIQPAAAMSIPRSMPARWSWPQPGSTIAFLFVALTAIMLLAFRSQPYRSRGALAVVLVVFCLISMAACGGSGSSGGGGGGGEGGGGGGGGSTTPGTMTIVLGGQTRTIDIEVIVQ